ncbi:MAG: DUF1499 domain-containing protein [Deltaproteobacteria bacterium]|nr:DUF1499 domain-containing protein [Deltaproteobacteria bacterium]MBW2360004.1 DUF1499 domain-containing protein [Deltaproteobacteria bacterium]
MSHLGRTRGLPLVITLLACAGSPPTDIGDFAARLAPCPSSPNCVSSDDESERHHIAALGFGGDPLEAWHRALAAVAALPRTQILREYSGYLHAQCTSALLRYRDDLELQLRPDRGEIAVRSASRIGYSDLGVNRARIEALRAAFGAGGS